MAAWFHSATSLRFLEELQSSLRDQRPRLRVCAAHPDIGLLILLRQAGANLPSALLILWEVEYRKATTCAVEVLNRVWGPGRWERVLPPRTPPRCHDE